MKFAVVGSRSFSDYSLLCKALESFDIDHIISGAAKGADTLAAKYAIEKEIPLKEIPADWDKHGNAAGPIRNKQIVDECDQVIAFWCGKSRGTKSTINLSHKQKKPVHIFWI